MSYRTSKQSRREHLVTWFRYAALGAVVGAGGLAVAKRRRLVRQGVCISGGVCRGCPILAKCDLPEAASAKEHVEKGNHGRTK